MTFRRFFFSEQRRGQTTRWILTLNGSKDAESRKDMPFGVKKAKGKSDPYLP